MRERICESVAAPFFSPKISQARLDGTIDEVAKKPPPTMKLSGLWSLKRNGSPGASARNYHLRNWALPARLPEVDLVESRLGAEMAVPVSVGDADPEVHGG
jgi:hypothetical protein